jgi:hypothetical protein
LLKSLAIKITCAFINDSGNKIGKPFLAVGSRALPPRKVKLTVMIGFVLSRTSQAVIPPELVTFSTPRA